MSIIHFYPARLAAYFQPLVDALTDHEVVFIDELEPHLPDMEILVHNGKSRIDWSPAVNLRLLQTTGAGVDGILPATGLSDDVVVCNNNGNHEPEMAEFAIAMLAALTYRLPTYLDQQRRHEWQPRMPRALEGQRLCIVGLGAIGQSVARRATALGMTVSGVRRSGAPLAGVEQVVRTADRLDALRDANAVVIVAPLTDETRGMIGAEEFAALAPGAIVVDISRGGVTDLDALIAALESNQISAAGIDVFPTEPLPADSPLWDVPNLIITPHVAGNSRRYPHRLGTRLAHNVNVLYQGGDYEGLVDRSAGY